MKTPHNLTREEINGVIKYMMATQINIDEDLNVEINFIKNRIYIHYDTKDGRTEQFIVIYPDYTMDELQQQIDIVLDILEKITQ